MVRPGRDRLRGRVEVDETYVGGDEEDVRGRQTKKKANALRQAGRCLTAEVSNQRRFCENVKIRRVRRAARPSARCGTGYVVEQQPIGRALLGVGPLVGRRVTIELV